MRILVAPERFKGSLTAAQAADAVTAGLLRVVPGLTIDRCPTADGGEGTCAAAVAAGFRPVEVVVTGPTGGRVAAGYAERDGVAVIELSAASGLHLLDGDVAPLTAGSRGTGELIAHALDHGARTVVVGLGDSACTDGGAGLLQGLGAQLRDAAGADIAPGGAALRDLCTLDLTALHPGLAAADLVLACDVGNPLLGPDGAAAVYGPRKGASPAEVAVLEAGLARWACVVAETLGAAADPAVAGSGAAGGAGYAGTAVLGARMRPGIDVLLELVGIGDRVARADLVITGEGALDARTLRGTAPSGVAAAAARHRRPTIAVAGRIHLGVAELATAGFAGGYALGDLELDPRRCIADAARLLEDVGARLMTDWLRGEVVRGRGSA